MGAALWLSSLYACGDNQDPEGAKQLWREIHDMKYREWKRAPGYAQRRSSNAPHGDKVDIYINDVLADALANERALDAWPEGSLIVKDGFDGSDLDLVAVMEKRTGGWYWAEYDADGDADYSGHPELCTDCHRKGDDYVRAFSWP